MRWNEEKKALPCGFDDMKKQPGNRLLLLFWEDIAVQTGLLCFQLGFDETVVGQENAPLLNITYRPGHCTKEMEVQVLVANATGQCPHLKYILMEYPLKCNQEYSLNS